MTGPTGKKSRTRQITLAASFAAVYFVLRSVPTFQMVGTSGRFTGGDFLLTSIAIVCGIWGGAVSVLIGTMLAYGVRPPIFFGLDFLPALSNVIVAALLLSSRIRVAQGVYLATFLAFILSPYSLLLGYGVVPYAWLHLVALAALVSPLATKIAVWVRGTGSRQVAGLGLLAFVGTMQQHLVGGLLYELVAGFVGGINPTNFMGFWRVIFWVYPVERLIIVIFSTIVAVAVMRALGKWNPNSLTT